MGYGIYEVSGGGVSTPAGFLASGVEVGIKRPKKDVAIIFSRVPAAAAGVFTLNVVKAAPVIISQKRVANGQLQAIVVNAGNANACTGPQGFIDAEQMCALTAKALGLEPSQVAVCSTGTIGVPLPMDKVARGISQAAVTLSASGGHDAALAIMTTDLVPKEAAVRFQANGTTVTVGGMAKGSGMIHPNMATMLGFLTTDARISPPLLQKALSQAVDRTFNMISVDGDTSTNDCCLMMANGVSGVDILEGTPEWEAFQVAVTRVCTTLAKLIARDGEGATKLLEVQVVNAPTYEDARKAARTVTVSPLVKTAIFGEDANWGRILCAAGYSGASFNPDKVDIWLGPVLVCKQGTGLAFDEAKAAEVLAQKEVTVKIDMHAGEAEAVAWGCDFSYDYVKINGSYRT